MRCREERQNIKMQEELLKQKEAHLVSHLLSAYILNRDHTLHWMLFYNAIESAICDGLQFHRCFFSGNDETPTEDASLSTTYKMSPTLIWLTFPRGTCLTNRK